MSFTGKIQQLLFSTHSGNMDIEFSVVRVTFWYAGCLLDKAGSV